MSTLELNAASEHDDSVDQEIDARTLRLSRSSSGIVFDSRLAWRIVPSAVKVFVACSPAIAGERVQKEGRGDEPYADASAATGLLIQRFRMESSRFREKYGANLDNLRNFDIVVDSSVLTASEIAEFIAASCSDPNLGEGPTRVVLSPRQIYPLSSLASVSPEDIQRYKGARSTQAWLDAELAPLQVVRVSNAWFALNDPIHLAHMIEIGRVAIPCHCVGVDDEVIRHRLTARQWVLAHWSPALTFDWEQAFGYACIEPADAIRARINPGVSGLEQ